MVEKAAAVKRDMNKVGQIPELIFRALIMLNFMIILFVTLVTYHALWGYVHEGSGYSTKLEYTPGYSPMTVTFKTKDRHEVGEEITVSRLAEIFRELEEQGANNINLVTPTHWAPVIAEALSLYRPGIPVLYNCGGYESVETLRRLEGLVDVWLPDIKYADPELARKFSGAPDYPETAYAAVEEMLRQCGHLQLDARGLAVRGVMIRHLVLPLHLKNSFAVLDRIAEQFGTETWVSLMFQYTPLREIQEYPELNRTLTRRERERAEAYLEEKGLLNGYVQEPDSKGTAFIPRFDLTGVR